MAQLSKKFDIDWQMLHGLMSDTIYGGRIDNSVDLRILNTYIEEYFNAEMVNGNKKLTEGLSTKNIEEFKKILPDTDTPALYGLSHGIDKAINRIKGKEALENLKILTTIMV
jgi:dynein heavy chain 2